MEMPSEVLSEDLPSMRKLPPCLHQTSRSILILHSNGKTAGISLPSADGQEAVIRKAMSKASLTPDDITYVECHGTGTKVGDAIEVESLSRVFQRPADRPLYIGSVKSNIGHSEAASGIAGVIKSILSLEKGLIPPTHGLKKLNPKLEPFKDIVSIPTKLIAWPGEKERIPRIGRSAPRLRSAENTDII